MSDEQFPGNPKLAKMVAKEPAEEPRVAGPVIQGEVIIRKPSIGKKLKKIFFNGDFKQAARYVAGEVALPALRNMIVDTTSKGIERVIFGPDRAGQRSSRGSNYSSRTSYNVPVNRNYPSAMLPHQPPYLSRNARMQMDDIVLPDRADCEMVLDMMDNIIERHKYATRADLMELLGRPSLFTDQKWGWGFLGSSEIVQVREGWLLDLPPMEPIQ